MGQVHDGHEAGSSILQNLLEPFVHPRGNQVHVALTEDHHGPRDPLRNLIRNRWACLEGIRLRARNPLPGVLGHSIP